MPTDSHFPGVETDAAENARQRESQRTDALYSCLYYLRGLRLHGRVEADRIDRQLGLIGEALGRPRVWVAEAAPPEPWLTLIEELVSARRLLARLERAAREHPAVPLRSQIARAEGLVHALELRLSQPTVERTAAGHRATVPGVPAVSAAHAFHHDAVESAQKQALARLRDDSWLLSVTTTQPQE